MDEWDECRDRERFDDREEIPKTEMELIRMENIALRRRMFAELFKECHDIQKEIVQSTTPKSKPKAPKSRSTPRYRTSQYNKSWTDEPSRRSIRLRTRTVQPNYHYNDTDEEGEVEKGKRLQVVFPWTKRVDRSFLDPHIDYDKDAWDSSDEFAGFQEDQDDGYCISKRVKVYSKVISRMETSQRQFLTCEEVTEEMLDDIAVSLGRKIYAKGVDGTTCHQCRQKTIDTKSVCRNLACTGVRGQFCGPCLLTRYGESVRDALLDPEWSCPPCRSLCNCSICRRQQNKLPTGILAPKILTRGYSSVADYLNDKEGMDCDW